MKTNLLLTAALSLSLCAASTAQTLPAYLPTDGLVGWWPFNVNANDESGNGNNGTVNGATLTVDRFGAENSAYIFDGNDVIDVNNISLTNDFTISLWFSADSLYVLPCGSHEIISSMTNDFNWPNGFSLAINEIGGLAIGNGAASTPYSEYYQINTWIYATINFISETSEMQLRVNGNLISSITPFAFNNVNDIIRIGSRANTSAFCGFNGKIDDIAIYNRALTPEEITALYTGEPNNPPTTCSPLPDNLQNGLVGYWPFCGNANDESGNGNDGTVNGATLTEDRFGDTNAAYDFDGESNFIEVLHSQTLTFENSISISIWLNSPDYSLNTNGLVERVPLGKQRSPDGSGIELETLDSGGDCCGAQFYLYNGSQIVEYTPIGAMPIDEWVHLTGTYDGGTLNLYQNGQLLGSSSGICDLSAISQNLFFGKEGSIGRFFKGRIDDIAIYNRALTPEEVLQLYTLNACTFTIYDTVTVTETIYDTVSVSLSTTDTLIINTLITAVDPAQENTFLVYPNPASTQITINNGNVTILGGYTMRITNSLGQDIYNQNITQSEVTLDLSTWSGNGLYVLYIIDPQQNIVAVKQIVLQ
jgi:hypothetical protein